MKLSIIGSGYVGLVSGICLASLGHTVSFYDSDQKKIAALRQGRIPIYEPGLAELLQKHKSNVSFFDDLAGALQETEAVFLCVGTPTLKATGEADLQYVFAASEQIRETLDHPALLVTKSTVPIGTNRQLAHLMKDKPVEIASNPEFLREGSALYDFMNPDRIVIGAATESAAAILKEVYKPFGKTPLVVTEWETAEMIKYAANTFLAMKVAFINEMADLCETVGADVDEVSHGIGLDPRIGRQFLKAGPGFGGSCFPKDTKALLKIAEKQEMDLPITEAVVSSNENRRYKMVDKIVKAFGGSVREKKIAILGLTFKPGTNDMRESVSLAILPELIKLGAHIHAYDPEGMEEAKPLLPGSVHYAASAKDCLRDADGAVIITEWDEFKKIKAKDFEVLRDRVVVDLRNIYLSNDYPSIALSSIGKKSFS